MPAKQIWCVYNHMSGGQVVATHFESRTRKRKMGDDKSEDVLFTAEDQLEGFRKSDFVALKIRDKDLVKNQVLVFPPNEDLPIDPAPAVLAWAEKQGIEPVKSAAEAAKQIASDEKVKQLEAQIYEQKGQISQIMEMLKQLMGKKEPANAS